MADVHLVQMPFAAVEHPSIGLSLLKAGLEALNISCRVEYPSLDFAERIGVRRYKLVDRCFTEDLVGEWVFSRAAFPEFAPDDQAYLDRLHLAFWPGAAEDLRALRGEAEAFIEETARRLLQQRPRLVGCSSVFAQNCASLALLRRLKELAPDVITVLGGANCEGDMGQTLADNFAYLDYVVSGEADHSFPALCRQLLQGAPSATLPPGVLRGHPSVRSPGPAPRATVHDLDRLPAPNYDDYFAALERSPLREQIAPGLMIETSRGCWWGQKHHCTFCGLNGQGIGYRHKSAPKVIEEFDELYRRHQVERFEVVDNIIAMDHLQTVLPHFAERGAPYRIFYETKSNLKRQQVELLARAGVRWIQPGIESMHSEILKLMDKGSTASINVCLLKWAREFGIRLSWNFLCDFPGEEDCWYEEMASWLPWISHLQPPGGLHRVRFDRFSPYFSEPEKYGLTIVPFDSYRSVYPLSTEDLSRIAYFFRGVGREASQPRPGLRALRQVIERWKDAFWNSSLPIILSATPTPDGVEFLDTRPQAPQRRRRISGLTAAVYQACQTPTSPASLQRTLAVSEAALQSPIQELLEAKLVLMLEGKLLALGVEGSLPTLPGGADFPGGALHDAPLPALAAR